MPQQPGSASPLFHRRYYVALALFGITTALAELLFLGNASPLASGLLGLSIVFNASLLLVPRRWLGQRLFESLPYAYFALLLPLWLTALYAIPEGTYALAALLTLQVYLTLYYALAFLIFAPERALRLTLVVLAVLVAVSLPDLWGSSYGRLHLQFLPLLMALAHLMLIFTLNTFAQLGPELYRAQRSAAHLEQLAYYDYLTGIANRRQVEVLAQHALASAQRRNESFSVVMLDIDHFKRFNDQYGHRVGDEVLRELATRLKSELRESDVFGRWGGEEFIVITSVTKEDEGPALAERLCKRLKAEPLFGQHWVTVSCGVAGYRAGDTLHTLINRADTALYRAKEEGRDRVVTFSASFPAGSPPSRA